MKPAVRWLIVGLVVVLLAILLWLWNPFGQEEASPDGDTVEQTAAPTPPAPPAAPVAPKVAEPVTAVVLFGFDQSVLRAEATAKLDELGARFKDGAFDRVTAESTLDPIPTAVSPVASPLIRSAATAGCFRDRLARSLFQIHPRQSLPNDWPGRVRLWVQTRYDRKGNVQEGSVR